MSRKGTSLGSITADSIRYWERVPHPAHQCRCMDTSSETAARLGPPPPGSIGVQRVRGVKAPRKHYLIVALHEIRNPQHCPYLIISLLLEGLVFFAGVPSLRKKKPRFFFFFIIFANKPVPAGDRGRFANGKSLFQQIKESSRYKRHNAHGPTAAVRKGELGTDV